MTLAKFMVSDIGTKIYPGACESKVRSGKAAVLALHGMGPFDAYDLASKWVPATEITPWEMWRAIRSMLRIDQVLSLTKGLCRQNQSIYTDGAIWCVVSGSGLGEVAQALEAYRD
jgi:hypothetical protein